MAFSLTMAPALGGAAAVMQLMLLMAAGGAVWWSGAEAAPCYPAIFVFGDSLSDTGNGNLSGEFPLTLSGSPPYGETFPGHPFGRFSDGRLIVDYLALYTSLPLLNPSLLTSADFSNGVNYAVAGATALDPAFLNSHGVPVQNRSIDLNVQVTNHLQFKAAAAAPGGSRLPSLQAFASGLYVILIGGNDYLNALRVQKASVISSTILPFVIARIRNATEMLLANGGSHFLIVSLPAIGCIPSQLASNRLAAKDQNGCVADENSLSYNHGVELLAMVQSLRASHPQARFIFADYYGSYIQALQNKASYGLTDTLDACCGGGVSAPYRFNILVPCSRISSTALTTLCSNPNTFVNWDGIHFTDKFNSVIFGLTVAPGSFLNPSNAFSQCRSK